MYKKFHYKLIFEIYIKCFEEKKLTFTWKTKYIFFFFFFFETVNHRDNFYPPPDEVGPGVTASPQPPAVSPPHSLPPPPPVRFSFLEQIADRNLWINFAHIHPLRGVDVPFGVYEVSPT